jgi:hypothetical protein
MKQLLRKRFIWIREKRRDGRASVWPAALSLITSIALAFLFLATIAGANPPGATIEYQVMTSDGLAAGYPFECWVVFKISSDPSIQGLALPAGATFRFTFPQAFTPQSSNSPQAVLLNGWSQGPIAVPFTVGLDSQNPRTIILKLTASLSAGPPERPGLKAIHLRWGPLNPTEAGDYPISIQLLDAGALSGTTEAIAHITAKPVPNVAAYNQLHEGRNEDWQHVKVDQTALLPVDLLVTLPDKARSFISLRPAADGSLEILGDGVPIGTVTRRGVPVTFRPEPFGPGFARLGIVRFRVTAGSDPGVAEIDAQLQGGPRYTLHVVVER